MGHSGVADGTPRGDPDPKPIQEQWLVKKNVVPITVPLLLLFLMTGMLLQVLTLKSVAEWLGGLI